MTKALIRKIKKIDNYRIFQNWKPSGNVEFARVNLIYGQNGSGKSTLASLMQGCAKYANEQFTDGENERAEIVGAGLQLQACDPSSSPASEISTISLDDRDFWGRVRVFNKDFVRRNLRFDEPDGPQPQALLTVGERVAEAEKRIEVLDSERKTAQHDLEIAESAYKNAKKNVSDLGTKVAKEIGDRLSGAPGFNQRSYNRTKVEALLKRFEGIPTILDDASAAPSTDSVFAKSRALQPIQIQPRNTLLEQNGLDGARQLLAASIVSNRHVGELVGHPDRSRWVQEGIGLHERLEECLFCGGGLTSDRRDALNAHFDESFKNLQARIDDLIERLEVSVKASKTYLDALPDDSKVYEDLREDLRKARQTYATEHGDYLKAAETISVALKEKKDNPFSSPALPSDLALVAPSSAALEKVIKDHQSKIEDHENEAKKAATRVEHYYVKNAADEYVRLKNEAESKHAARNELEAQVNKLNEQIAALQNVEGDPIPGATELTEGLRRLLGRDELKFSAQDSNHYTIKREGSPATHLSEGEQTAIALLYFLSSVREDKISGDPPIVIIDDPVSSLDNEILFGVSAHIWSEFIDNTYASQLFLMTHNFELFRQWLIQLEARQQYEDCNYAAYEMTPVYAPRGRDEFLRKPRLARWETDKDRTKVLRSEYHFLFSKVAHAVADRREDETKADQLMELALIPNAARRMLEAFLSFRCPNRVGSFHVALEEVMNSAPNLDMTVRTRVEKYLHAYSHFDGGNFSQPLRLNEATTVLRSLFQLMYCLDSRHVSSMCEALSIEEHKLLGMLTPVASKG
ncbi:hypothetical protein D4740_02095 [Actinomyces sp. 2119]|uniref:AAA family ATPase n=1 Tax=Actinomyces sp. 2119 TaxID=2321393 RepID=UPI000E6C5DF1|nr:AAA family ATPase [Actinomyces sp. 2119]RJF43786.1 hypothetical protein D4740_02095 [Actinomyces sp. 2119]